MKRLLLISAAIATSTMLFAQPGKGDLLDSSSVKLDLLPTNTVQSDFGPTVIGDSLYFTTFGDDLLEKTEKRLRKKEFYDLYNAPIDANGEIIGPRHAINEFITRYHDGPVTWCARTGELFMTRSNYTDPVKWYKPFRENYVNLRIVIAKNIDGVWKETEEFSHNNPEYSVGHPAISAGGDTLIFSSNMPGGFGETDLYLSVRQNGTWSKPVNLGEKINTPGKDEFPFITADGFMIFASNGRGGLGGLDLFYTKLKGGEITHFGTPVNSEADDFAATIPANAEYGYISSNRPGKGNDDIYKLTFRRYIEYLLEVSVLDEKSKRPIAGATVTFNDGVEKTTSGGGNVNRMIEREKAYSLTAKAFGYTDETKKIQTGNLTPGSVVRDTVWMKMIVKKGIELKNIYYDFDKWNILPESEIELNKLVAFMSENPEITVELSSHTDSRGSNAYNQKLSEKRAESAVSYIVSKGISPDRIKAIGYGESQLINQCKDGVWCPPEVHRLNRRTEFLIPGIGESVPATIDTKEKVTGNEATAKAKPAPVTAEKFHLVLGSFMDRANAEKLQKQLVSQGHQAKILSENKPFKVGIGYNSLSSAKKALIDFKQQYPNAWIY